MSPTGSDINTYKAEKNSNERIPTVRKLLAGLTTFGVAALVAGLATPAYANITGPGANAQLRGTAGFSASGTGSAGYCADTGRESSTTLQLVNGGGGVIAQSSASGSEFSQGSSTSFNYVTENQPNGAYTVRDTETYYYEHGFLSCSTRQNLYTETVDFDNQSSTSYSGDTSGHSGQSVTVSASVHESGGNNINPPAGQVIRFTLSGGNTVSATTNSAGFASANLPVTGAPRGATITASYPSQWYAASSAATGFSVLQDPSTVSVSGNPSTPAYGQADTFTANVSSTAYGTNPNGTPTGQVQFEVNGGNYGSPVGLNGSAQASITDPSLGDVGSYTITAIYSGDDNYSGNSASNAVTVVPAATSTMLVPIPTSTVYGQAVSFTATVSTTPPGSGAPIGTVTFQVNGSPFGAEVPVASNGQATSSPISTLGADTYQITAIYNPGPDGAGHVNFAGSQATINYSVGKASTSTTEVSSATPYAVYGQAIQFTATVGPVAPGAGTPTGTVDFQVEGVSPGSTSQGAFTDIGPGTLNGGSATSPAIATLTPGFYEVEAIYNGDGNFSGSSTTSLTQDVTPDPTATTLQSSSNPSVYGQPVSMTATVAPNAPGAGNPTGLVDFQIQSTAAGSTATDLGTVALSGDGATMVLPNEPAGTYVVTATYEGSPDADFFSSSTTLTQQINPDPTTTAVTSSVNPSVYGQPVTFTTTVSANAPGTGEPSGSVDFADGTTDLGSAPLAMVDGNDQASVTTISALSVGDHAITATYSGDPNFVGSNNSLTQVVNQAQTTTAIAPNGNVVQGQSVTFTATVAPVAPGSGAPTGTVQFAVNGASLGSPVTVENGTATSIAISNLSPGSYQASAAYSGDVDFLSSGGAVGQSVAQAATATGLSVTPTNAAGTQVDLIATVAPLAPGAGAPSGTVEFFDGSTFIAEAELNQASPDEATATDIALAVGSHSLSADYLGDYNYGPSSGTTTYAVSRTPTSTSLASSLNPSTYGAPVTFTATIAPQYSGPGLTGTVTFSDGSASIGTASVQSSGGTYSASITVSNLAVGGHSITASYAGDGNDGSSASSSLAQVVNKAPTSINAEAATGSGTMTAVLTMPQGPLTGQTLTFSTGSTQLCTAITDASGTASCTAPGLDNLTLQLSGSYTVTYAGNSTYLGSSATGKA